MQFGKWVWLFCLLWYMKEQQNGIRIQLLYMNIECSWIVFHWVYLYFNLRERERERERERRPLYHWSREGQKSFSCFLEFTYTHKLVPTWGLSYVPPGDLNCSFLQTFPGICCCYLCLLLSCCQGRACDDESILSGQWYQLQCVGFYILYTRVEMSSTVTSLYVCVYKCHLSSLGPGHRWKLIMINLVWTANG